MLKEHDVVSPKEGNGEKGFLQSFNPVTQSKLPERFKITADAEVIATVRRASDAFQVYKNKTVEERSLFLEAIAEEIMALGDELIQCAMLETALPEARLIGERARTVGQLKLFAEVLREGSWVEAVIDTALPERKPFPRSDIRKMLIPIGPVAIFGSSNFPFAFSTAGGDTASALAAGNTVVIKAHNSHLGTNELVASAILKAVDKCAMPGDVFSYVVGEGPVTGIQLVKNEGIKAVAFTGSYNAGMAIFKAASNDRETPIPVYAEMSSINPVLLLPEKIKQDEGLAEKMAASVTLGAGQFCTNPGILFVMENEDSKKFVGKMTKIISSIPASTMLNPNICFNYYRERKAIGKQKGVNILFEGEEVQSANKASNFLTQVKATDFISNPDLQREVFGPASLIVFCENKQELLQSLRSLHGQLTATIHGDATDFNNFADCIDLLSGKVGRLLYNGVPTGVEVTHAMVHGGPYPATTNVNYTSVGTDAIKRFVRPLCLQNCPPELLPDALKDNNPLSIMRKVNGYYTREGFQGAMR